MIWLKVFISGCANSHAIPMDEKKANTSAINAHLTRNRSNANIWLFLVRTRYPVLVEIDKPHVSISSAFKVKCGRR